MKLVGRVKSGVGEGGFFMGREPYASAMEENLGYRPYIGTLNMAAEKKDAQAFISQLKDITIPGFTRGIKTFGAVHCYPCALKGAKVAIIVPEFTRYGLDTVEIIAEEHLRTVLKLKDGNEITLAP